MKRMSASEAWAVLGTLGVLIGVVVPHLGSDSWPFQPPSVDPRGVLGPLVRAADRHWDFGVVRTPAILAAAIIVLAAAVHWRRPTWPRELVGGLCLVVVLALLVPAVLLQAGLRDATAPWYDVNDSTYQIELGGDLLRHGHNPYGHDYTGSGLERWYPAAGFDPNVRQVALHHFAYFPGTPITAALWGVLPKPLDDYRLFVLLATIGLFGAVLLFRAPLAWRLALGAAVAANPLAVHAAWIGTADAPSLLCLVLAFALLTRQRLVWASFVLGLAVLLKQFALVAVPFFVLMLLAHKPTRTRVRDSGLAFALPLVAGIVPFLVASPGAFWRDTIEYGGSTYRIIGYGLSNLFLKAGIVDDRFGSYPFFWLALFLWLPLTLWLLWNVRQSTRLWTGVAGFAASIFFLFFISRVFQTSYLIWPLTGILIAVLLANSNDERRSLGPDVPGEIDGRELKAVTTRP